MNNVKLWPHLTLIALVCALVGGGAAALWMRNEPKAEALSLPRAARLERVDGEVGLDRSLDTVGDEMLWEAEPNTPLTEGDRLYAGDAASAGVAFSGRNYARLDPDTALDVLSLSGPRTQLALRSGSAVFDLGELADDEFYEVATPYGAVELREPGLYHLGMNEDGGGAFVSVLSGLAQVVGLAGSGEIGKGEMLTLLGQTAAEIALSRLNPDYAGGLLDDYYGYRYPDAYDGRYADYNAYLNDPDYYDPYQSYQSYRYVPQSVPGAWELDGYGDWMEVGDYGYAWRPRVEDGWAPYQQGSWVMDEPYGLTWVSSEPWGYTPYHYGRWANVGGQWYWVPERDRTPSYAPALVAFLPLAEQNQVAWVPLAPGDAYNVPYYDEQWQPHYYNGDAVVPESVANFGVPGALTVVPSEYFGRRIDRGVIARADPSHFERQRPVVEPLSHAMLRQLSLTRANERRGFNMPPGLAKRLGETQVYASAPPPSARERRGRSERAARQVAEVPAERKREKMKFRDERREEAARQPAAPAAAARAARGREAREAVAPRGRGAERREERRAERRDERQDRVRPQGAPPQEVARPANDGRGRGNEQRARGERVGMRPQPAPRFERPQPPPRQQAQPRPQPQPRPQAQPRQQGPPRQQAGPPPQARPQRVEQPRPQRQQAQPRPERGRGGGGPPERGGGGKQQGGGGKGKGNGRP